MGLPETYAVNAGAIPKFFEAIQTAGVPDRVTYEFLKTIGFTSSNDRNLIAVMKAIGFLDQNGVPTQQYKAFRDPADGPRVLAQAIREAYSDLFLANMNAHELSVDKVKGIVATKTSKGERVVLEIARTFKALVKTADFTAPPSQKGSHTHRAEQPKEEPTERAVPPIGERPPQEATFHYNIQIHLPTTTDIAVYNAIFKSLKEHLL